MPATIEDLGKKVKAKHPGQYDDLSDIELGRKVKTKYPTDYADFTDIVPKPQPSGNLQRTWNAFKEWAPGGAAPDWPELGPQFRQQVSDVAQGVAALPSKAWESLTRGGQAMVRGDVPGLAWHTAGAFPGFGPMTQQVATDIHEKKYPEAAGHFLNLGAQALAPSILEGAGSAADALPGAVTDLKRGVSGFGEGASEAFQNLPTSKAGKTVGRIVGGLAGGKVMPNLEGYALGSYAGGELGGELGNLPAAVRAGLKRSIEKIKQGKVGPPPKLTPPPGFNVGAGATTEPIPPSTPRTYGPPVAPGGALPGTTFPEAEAPPTPAGFGVGAASTAEPLTPAALRPQAGPAPAPAGTLPGATFSEPEAPVFPPGFQAATGSTTGPIPPGRPVIPPVNPAELAMMAKQLEGRGHSPEVARIWAQKILENQAKNATIPSFPPPPGGTLPGAGLANSVPDIPTGFAVGEGATTGPIPASMPRPGVIPPVSGALPGAELPLAPPELGFEAGTTGPIPPAAPYQFGAQPQVGGALPGQFPPPPVVASAPPLPAPEVTAAPPAAADAAAEALARAKRGIAASKPVGTNFTGAMENPPAGTPGPAAAPVEAPPVVETPPAAAPARAPTATGNPFDIAANELYGEQKFQTLSEPAKAKIRMFNKENGRPPTKDDVKAGTFNPFDRAMAQEPAANPMENPPAPVEAAAPPPAEPPAKPAEPAPPVAKEEAKVDSPAAAETEPVPLSDEAVEAKTWPQRYQEMEKPHGWQGAKDTYAKDTTIAKGLLDSGVSPEEWNGMTWVDKNKAIKVIRPNSRPLGKGGSRARPQEVGSSHLEMRMRELMDEGAVVAPKPKPAAVAPPPPPPPAAPPSAAPPPPLKETAPLPTAPKSTAPPPKMDVTHTRVAKFVINERDATGPEWWDQKSDIEKKAYISQVKVPIAEGDAAFDAQDRGISERIRQLTNQQMPGPPEITPAAEAPGGNIEAKLDKIANAASERMRKRGDFSGTSLKANFPAESTADMAIWGAAKLAKGAVSFGKWSKEMLADAGVGAEALKPQLPKLFAQAQKTLERHIEQTAGTLPSTNKLLRMYQTGKVGEDWYRYTQAELEHTFGKDAPLFVDFLSATSPNATVAANTSLAVKAYIQYKTGQPFKGYMPTVIENLNRAAAGEPISGMKINSFKSNLFGDPIPVTIDRWMHRSFGFTSDAPTAAQYKFMDYAITQIAKERGIEPRQLQAAIWKTIKEAQGKAGNTSASFETVLRQQMERDPRLASAIKDAVLQGATAK